MTFREEEKLCKSGIFSSARHSRDRHAMLPTPEEEDQCAQCTDDITNKELPWSAVRQARELEL